MKALRTLWWALRVVVAAVLFVAAAGMVLVAARLLLIGGAVVDAMPGLADKALITIFSLVVVGMGLGVAGLIYGLGRAAAGGPAWIPSALRLPVLFLATAGMVVSALLVVVSVCALGVTMLTFGAGISLGEWPFRTFGWDVTDFTNRIADVTEALFGR